MFKCLRHEILLKVIIPWDSHAVPIPSSDEENIFIHLKKPKCKIKKDSY